MAIKNCNVSAYAYAGTSGAVTHKFNICVSTDKHEDAYAENLTMDDLKWLRDELSRSINLEKKLINGDV